MPYSAEAEARLVADFPELSADDVNWPYYLLAYYGLLQKAFGELELTLEGAIVGEDIRKALLDGSLPPGGDFDSFVERMSKEFRCSTLGPACKKFIQIAGAYSTDTDFKTVVKARNYYMHRFLRYEGTSFSKENIENESDLRRIIVAMYELRELVSSLTEVVQEFVDHQKSSITSLPEWKALELRVRDVTAAVLQPARSGAPDAYGWELDPGR